MAIPFYIPSDEETASNYRSMDELLWQLCDVLRQILLHRAPVIAEERNDDRTTPRTEQRPAVPDVVANLPDVVADLPRLPLPDLVQGAASASPRRPQRRHENIPVAPPRRRRRRRCVGKDADVHHVTAVPSTASYRLNPPLSDGLRKVEVRDNWTQVGEDLKKIADEFHASLQEFEQQETKPPSANKKALVSLLVPHGPIWMAVIVLLGWGAIQRTR